MITKEQAMQLKLGDMVRHRKLIENVDGDITMLHAIVIAECIIDKNKPKYFNVRVQCKTKRTFNIIELTAGNWDIVKQGKTGVSR